MIGITEAAELAEDFRATANYPEGDDHRLSIVIETLARASKSIPHAKVIVETWLAEQRFFPTPADLRSLSNELMDPDKVGKVKCSLCRGDRWAQSYRLVTFEQHDGAYCFRRSQAISQTEYEDLLGKVDGQTQRVYTTAERCLCQTRTGDGGS